MKTQKFIVFILSGVLSLSTLGLAACKQQTDDNKSKDTTEKETPLYTTDDYKFTTVYTNDETAQLEKYNNQDPTLNGVQSYTINKSIGNNNYIKLEVQTNVNLVGMISYCDISNPDRTNQEKFFIESGETEFKMFLDAFRSGAYGKFKKMVTAITLQNVDEDVVGEVWLKSFSISDRVYDPDYMMYLDDGTLRLGMSLSFGGAIKSIERIDADVVEYLDEDNNVRIERDVDTDEVNVISSSVNLVNIYDLGREIQQSLYWQVTSANGYNPVGDNKYSAETEPNYNPIQCGSATGVYPQIVDYSYTKNCLYIKAYGQDWFFENSVDATYYENWFYFGEDGVLLVDNRITNFTQFTGTDQYGAGGQETPAFYCVQPLNYFYCETKQGTIMDNMLSSIPSTKNNYKTSYNDNVSGAYHYELDAKNVPQAWCAFVNSNMFGIGIYSPNADHFNASRGTTSTSILEKENTVVHDYMYKEDYSKITPSCYVSNYNYLNTSITIKMTDFVPLAFSYALFAGEVDEMRTAFNALQESGKMVKKELSWATR